MIWAPALKEGAVLLSTRGGDYELTVGQDLSIGYTAHDRTTVELYLTECVHVPRARGQSRDLAASRALSLPALPLDLPPIPRGLKGRKGELATLSKTIAETAPTRLALIGAGGSGKSMLACALAHRLAQLLLRPGLVVSRRVLGLLHADRDAGPALRRAQRRRSRAAPERVLRADRTAPDRARQPRGRSRHGALARLVFARAASAS